MTVREIETLREYCEFTSKRNGLRGEPELNSIENLQLAFLHTFPKNIAMSADVDLEYPFYLMVRDKTLMKVHGTSIVPLYKNKPQWVSCQNLVISSVTGRPMARLVVPIDEKHLKLLEPIDYKRAMDFKNLELAQKHVEREVGTSILRHLRSKNHNQHIQKALEQTQAYLETDDLKEVIVYFYVKDVDNESGKKLQIMDMVEDLRKYYTETVNKRHFLPSLSERTKLHVNELGRIVDILSSREFISFGIRAVGGDYIDTIKKFAKEQGIPDSKLDIYQMKDRGLINVQVNDKRLSARLFQRVNTFCQTRNTKCFPFCGSSLDLTTKFKRWKAEICWYEGPKNSEAAVFTDSPEVYEELGRIISLTYRIIRRIPPGGRFKCLCIVAADVIGEKSYRKGVKPEIDSDQFKDEIAFEDWLKTKLKGDQRSAFSVSVRRRTNHSDERFTAEDQFYERKIEKAVEEFCRGKAVPESLNLKELDFILKSGLNRDIARNIDFRMREKLEQAFPALNKFHVLCFKRKGYSTLRKAHVYQSDDGYKDFMDKLQSLMQKKSGKYEEQLKSRVKISFTGKYVIQIEEGTYKNFMDQIQNKIRESGLSHAVKQLIKRREISLFGNHEKRETMRQCVKEIMSMLHSTTLKLDPELLKYDNYAMKCELGEAERSKWNNKLTGKATCIYNHFTNELTLKGTETHREDMKNRLESWVRNFLNRVKTEKYIIKNKRRYFEKAAGLKKSARDRVDAHTFLDRTQEPPILLIYYYDQKEDDRSLTPAIRKEQIQDLRKYFDTILDGSQSDHGFEKIPIHHDDKCQLCNMSMDTRFRLICKHIYCEVCIRQHVIETADEDGCFCPVCEDQIFLIDLTSILPPDDLKPLFLKQKDAFLSKNSGKYKNCPTPDCGNILCNPDDTNPEVSGYLQPNKNTSTAFCDNCGQDYCFLCLKSHIDEDCAKQVTSKQTAKLQEKAQKDVIFQKDSDNESRDKQSVSFAKLLDDISDSRVAQTNFLAAPSMSVSQSREAPQVGAVYVCPGCRHRCTDTPSQTYSLICKSCKKSFCILCNHNFEKQAEKKEIYDHAVNQHGLYKNIPRYKPTAPPKYDQEDNYFE